MALDMYKRYAIQRNTQARYETIQATRFGDGLKRLGLVGTRKIEKTAQKAARATLKERGVEQRLRAVLDKKTVADLNKEQNTSKMFDTLLASDVEKGLIRTAYEKVRTGVRVQKPIASARNPITENDMLVNDEIRDEAIRQYNAATKGAGLPRIDRAVPAESLDPSDLERLQVAANEVARFNHTSLRESVNDVIRTNKRTKETANRMAGGYTRRAGALRTEIRHKQFYIEEQRRIHREIRSYRPKDTILVRDIENIVREADERLAQRTNIIKFKDNPATVINDVGESVSQQEKNLRKLTREVAKKKEDVVFFAKKRALRKDRAENVKQAKALVRVAQLHLRATDKEINGIRYALGEIGVNRFASEEYKQIRANIVAGSSDATTQTITGTLAKKLRLMEDTKETLKSEITDLKGAVDKLSAGHREISVQQPSIKIKNTEERIRVLEGRAEALEAKACLLYTSPSPRDS